MPRSRILLAILATSSIFASGAAGQLVRGRLVDDATEAPVQGAAVHLVFETRGKHKSALTDSAGNFVLEAAQPGSYTLRAERIGYRTVSSAALHLLSIDTVEVELRVGADVIPLAPLTVTAASRTPIRARLAQEFEDRRKSGWGQYVGPDEVDRLAPFRATDLLTGTSGVYLIGNPPQPLMRGGYRGMCAPNIFVDGKPALLGDQTVDDLVPAARIRAVEIYNSRSNVPARFGSLRNSLCGAIVLWTDFAFK